MAPIGLDSPLLRVPADTERRLVLALDGIRYGVGAAEISLARLEQSLESIMGLLNDWPRRRNVMYYATVDAWAIIDSVFRLRTFVGVVPRIKRKAPALQKFLSTTTSAHELRHFVQHMAEKLPALERAAQPLWGSISWRGADDLKADKQVAYAFVAGTLYPDAHAPVVPFGPKNSDRIGKIELSAGGFTAELRGLVGAATELVRHFESTFLDAFQSTAICASDSMVHMTPTMKGFDKTGKELRLKFTANRSKSSDGMNASVSQ